MASLDPYLEYTITKKAKQLILMPGKKPTLVQDSGTTTFGQAIHGSQIKIAVLELLNKQEQAAFLKNGNSKTDYKLKTSTFKLVARIVDSGVEVAFFNTAVMDTSQTKSTATSKAATIKPQTPVSQPINKAKYAKLAIDTFLLRMYELNSSDLHLCSGRIPRYRVDGDLITDSSEVLSYEILEKMLFEIIPEAQKQDFKDEGSCDFSYAIPEIARFRFNIFKEHGGISAAARLIPSKIMSAKDLNLPPAVCKLASLPKGLVLVTGPTGSGKSTTLAALLDLINIERKDHILTIESPIEFLHEDKSCLVHQREVGNHTSGFKTALRDALREDPDIVLIGEMRDLETISTAIETASTGHLVLGTLHTTTAPSTVNRIIEIFPPEQQAQVRYGLAESLKAVVSQVLLKKKGGGRIAALEILIVTPSVSNMIREQKTHQLINTMQTGRRLGMRLITEELVNLVKDNIVEAKEAFSKAMDKEEFVRMLNAAGVQFEPPSDTQM